LARRAVFAAVTVRTLHDPSHREALWALEAAFDRGELITVFGECRVDYEGRASSTLGAGKRLLVLKPDGSALVHTDEKRTPVNWQPPGSDHYAAVREGRLRVRSVRTSPDETLAVRFADVEQLSAMGVTGGRDLEVRGSEADLRRRILEEPNLVEEGLDPVAVERDSAAGPMDVLCVDADSNPVVLELKRRRVGPSAVSQLGRYVEALGDEDGVDPDEVRGILVSPSITDRARELLAEQGFEHAAVEPPDSQEQADGESGESGEESGDSNEGGSGEEPIEETDRGEDGNADSGEDGSAGPGEHVEAGR
jgi:RecB family endonuclease NucS